MNFDISALRSSPPSTDPLGAPAPPDPAAVMAALNPQQQADPYALSDAQLLDLYEATRKLCEPGREVFEAVWWRALLYVLGRHWIYYNTQSKTWNDKRTAKWIPKPVTNVIGSGVQALRAMLASIALAITAAPIGNKAKNQMAAQSADDVIPLLHKEAKMSGVMRQADSWAITTGNVFLNPYWNPEDRTRMAPVAIYPCLTCGATPTAKEIVDAKQRCPVCRQANFGPEQQSEPRPLGKLETLVASPFEILLPLYAQTFEKVDRLIYLTWRPRHQIEDEYDVSVYSKIGWEKSPKQTSLQMFRALATQVDFQLSPEAYSTAVMAGEIEGTTEAHLWIKPCKKFPEGLYQRFLDSGKIVARETDPTTQQPKRPIIPTRTNKGKPLWPWIHYGYEPVDGRLYCRGAVDPAISKNDQINRGDSMVELTMMRMGNPVWLEPKGAEVERLTGEPGLIVRWQPTGANGAKPERIGGESPPAAMFTLRAQHVQDAEEQLGSYDVLKGTKPSGVEAYSALQLLVERSQSRFANVFANRAEAYRAWAEIAVELERTYGPPERVKATQGPNKTWTHQTFLRAELDGDFEILTQDGSTTPKTSLGKRAALEHGKQLGVVNPADPDQQYSMLQDLGLMHLAPSLDADVKAALEEQEAFEEWCAAGMQGGPASCPLVRLPFIQNDMVHYTENRKWANSDQIRELLMDSRMGQTVLQLITQHLEQHYLGAQQQAMAEAGAQAGGAQAGGGNGRDGRGVGAGRAAANSNTESGAVGGATRV